MLCPPLAVLAAGKSAEATANVALTFLLYVPGLLHALAVVERSAAERRTATLARIAVKYYS